MAARKKKARKKAVKKTVIAEPVLSRVQQIQKILFPNDPNEWDGIWGRKSRTALEALIGTSTVNQGKASWYSQYRGKYTWIDTGDRPNSNALGVPDDQQGIALPTRTTLGEWFNVTAPNGTTLRLRQTDLGPAAWTGRKIDIAAVAAEMFGYSPRSFPTDEGLFKWQHA